MAIVALLDDRLNTKPNQSLGLCSNHCSNHWSAWLASENSYKHRMEFLFSTS